MKNKILSFMLMLVLILTASLACTQNPGIEKQVISFGVYSIPMNQRNLWTKANSTGLKNVILEQDSSLVYWAYIPTTDTISNLSLLNSDSLLIMKTSLSVDNEHNYFGLVVLKNQPVIEISDLKKNTCNGADIELFFNKTGTKKWAEFTKQNTGNTIAFTYNNLVYHITTVNAEIKNGRAIIKFIESKDKAEEICKALNSNILEN